MKNFFKSLAALALCLYLGGIHLAILQIVAWTGMVVVYSGQEGMREGISRTFSGEKPCPLCKVIESAKKQEKPENPSAPLPPKGAEKILKELVPVAKMEPPAPRAADAGTFVMPWPAPLPGIRSNEPLTPPPRQVA